ncbi:primary active transporter [Lithospermum erythrorhizon]|uniref:Peroxisomal membrane protein PEX14 n=1 Tax=Lithospermum erythrorhizon TaxID=34254 RepID=A0AAV3QCD5_LITER
MEDTDKPQNPDSQVVQPATQVNEGAKTEPVKDASPTSVFVNSEPIREDQVQNAVKFLSHPKVRGSPVLYRRSFLEKKGLTKEEIDEAFRRVPDPTPAVSSTQTTVANQDGQQKSASEIKTGGAVQTVQSSNVAPIGGISRKGTFSSFHWSHAFIAVGVLAVSGAGTAALLKKIVIPKFKSWIRKVVLEEEDEGPSTKSNLTPTFAEEAASAAKAAAAAASDVARASQEMLLSKREDKKYFEDLTKLLDIQVHEIKSMSNAIQKLEGQGNSLRNTQVEYDDYRVSASAYRVPQQSYSNGKVDVDSRSVRYSSPRAPAEFSAPPHQKSYMEVPHTSNNVFQPPQGNGNSSVEFQDNQLNGTSSAPWWQQKNVNISEIETEDEQKMGPSGVSPIERTAQRSWVPPRPPPVAMAEAAAAIRQPKKPPSQKEHLTDDQLLSQDSNASDELQRITKISEAGGSEEANGGSSGPLSTNEMQKGEEIPYLEA